MTKELSIIIVSYNTKELTKQCISSVQKSNTKADYEIIVVDNNSDDGSREELQKIKGIKLVENKRNYGFAKANNQGINKASGKYILLLNSDTVVTRGSIDKLYEFAVEHSNIGAVGAKLLNKDGSVQASAFHLPTVWRTLQAYWLGRKYLVEKYIPQGDEPVKVEVLVMAAFLITPLALKKVGLLNENYFMYFEDFDYCRELKRNGLDVYYLPTAEIYHYHGQSGKNLSSDANQWRRLIPSSKIYHGLINHWLIFLITWSRQKWEKFIG